MRQPVNTAVNLLKWPMAVAMILLVVPALPTLARVAWHVGRHPKPWLPLWLGLAVFVALWWLQLRRSGSKSWLYTLEHELTHALFAVLTLNRVTSLSAQQGSGHLAYEGPGNWLVSLSPYFFPAFCVLPLLALQVAGPAAQPPLLGLLGLTLGLHIHATWLETHLQQTDLQNHGQLASACILPGAMLMSLLGVVAAVPGQYSMVATAWLASVRQLRGLISMWS